MKNAFTSLSLILCIISFFSCGDDDENQILTKQEQTKQLLVGQWKCLSIKNELYNKDWQKINSIDVSFGKILFEISEDELKSYYNGSLSYTGRYSIEERGDKIYLLVRSASSTTEVEIVLLTKESLTWRAVTENTSTEEKIISIQTYARQNL